MFSVVRISIYDVLVGRDETFPMNVALDAQLVADDLQVFCAYSYHVLSASNHGIP